MDLIFKNKDKKNNTSPVKEQNPINSNASITEAKEIEKSESEI